MLSSVSTSTQSYLLVSYIVFWWEDLRARSFLEHRGNNLLIAHPHVFFENASWENVINFAEKNTDFLPAKHDTATIHLVLGFVCVRPSEVHVLHLYQFPRFGKISSWAEEAGLILIHSFPCCCDVCFSFWFCDDPYRYYNHSLHCWHNPMHSLFDIWVYGREYVCRYYAYERTNTIKCWCACMCIHV